MLGGRPRNLSDCLDFAGRGRPVRVCVDLAQEERFTEMYSLRQYVGGFRWDFGGFVVEVRHPCGGSLAGESQRRRCRSVEAANRRLEKVIRRIMESNVDVVGKEKRFGGTMHD